MSSELKDLFEQAQAAAAKFDWSSGIADDCELLATGGLFWAAAIRERALLIDVLGQANLLPLRTKGRIPDNGTLRKAVLKLLYGNRLELREPSPLQRYSRCLQAVELLRPPEITNAKVVAGWLASFSYDIHRYGKAGDAVTVTLLGTNAVEKVMRDYEKKTRSERSLEIGPRKAEVPSF